MLALLSLLFGGLATLLAAIGLYGVMSYTVARRTREIGLRSALGADGADVVRMVLREVGLLTGLGVVLGLPAAYAAGRAAESQLFGLSPLDPVSLAGAALLLAVICPCGPRSTPALCAMPGSKDDARSWSQVTAVGRLARSDADAAARLDPPGQHRVRN